MLRDPAFFWRPNNTASRGRGEGRIGRLRSLEKMPSKYAIFSTVLSKTVGHYKGFSSWEPAPLWQVSVLFSWKAVSFILVGESTYWLQALSEFGQELCKVIHKAIQALNFFHIGGLRHFQDCFGFLLIDFDSFICQFTSRESDFLSSQFMFFPVKSHAHATTSF